MPVHKDLSVALQVYAAMVSGGVKGKSKDLQEKAWRSHLALLPVFAGPRWDGAAGPNNSTRLEIACIASDTDQMAGDGISESLRAGLGGSPFFSRQRSRWSVPADLLRH